jgi:hypothetical protein
MRPRTTVAVAATVLCLSSRVLAQENADSQTIMIHILQRLDALERENRQLLDEVHALKQQLDGSRLQAESPPQKQQDQQQLENKVEVQGRRIEEQAQTKVEASQKFPISINGMLLFNAFANSSNPETETSDSYGLLTGPSKSGATVRQTLLGLQYQGPSLPGDGHVNGSLMMDFWAGPSYPSSNWLRIRQADLSFDWANRSFSVGQQKPLIAPYQPNSLAEVGIPPLAGAGNLWVWEPQVRYEEKMHFGQNSGVTTQVAVLQTGERYQIVPAPSAGLLEQARPGLEGRVALWHKFDDVRRFEIAPGFHASTSHFGGQSVDSRIGSIDWLFVPASKIEFTGTFYTGKNVAGLGSLGNGFTLRPDGTLRAVDTSAGWSQISAQLTKRLTLNLFGGLESDNAAYANANAIVRNLTYASNLMYHLGPNVVVSLEALQMRTRNLAGMRELYNHYDLAFGYLF